MNFIKSVKPILKEASRISVIMGLGDVIAQTLVEKRPLKELDKRRTARFTAIGFCFVGPILRVWYTKLNHLVSPEQPKLHRGLKKMACDQLLFAPVFTASVLVVFGLTNGESVESIKKRLQNDYIHIMKLNYTVWPTAQLINFSLIPVQYQVLFSQLIAVFWNCYLSLLLNK